MDLFQGAESLMRMSAGTWARHANPWSVYTRLAASLPTFLAIWSIHWIGWLAILPIGFMAVWTFLNPRIFAAPANAESWAARGVLGERAFLNRKKIPIPPEHLLFGYLTTGCCGMFMIVVVWAFFASMFWWALTAWLGVVLSKVWFVDRMAWLWNDVKGSHPVYIAWANADWSKTL
ncbi:DUF6653 family protein [uncultured Roseibium sp.]|uniref:DUF6653 family protein n=1 Tax=uncultured Roseibium sp. TaxID=1936171 RepID=UPI0026228001|nr:DUF6653 family protein [uncultured Roseibium sp.]